MTYATVCSGIEAPSVAWEPLGWKPVFFSEIEKFPSSTLAHHWPDVPNYGDMTNYKEWPDHGKLDFICGGTPCQSFSVAGLRKGLDDPRGNLTLTYLAVIDRYRPRWVVWENVPGVLSADGGRAFGAFLGGLAELGYGFAYRVLDAQHFGVPQRRRRVFVVGYLGDWRPPAAVLFERHSLSGHSAPGRETGEGTAGGAQGGAGFRYQNEQAGIVEDCISATLRKESSTTDERSVPAFVMGAAGRGKYKEQKAATSLRSEDHQTDTDLVVMAHRQGNAEICRDGSPFLTCNHEAPICFNTTQVTSKLNYSNPKAGDPAHPLAAGAHAPCVAARTAQTGANGHGVAEDVAHTLDGAQGQAVAFHHKASPSQTMNPSETCPTLDKSKSPAVAFQESKQDGVAEYETAGSLRSNAPGHQPCGSLVRHNTTVRRLTPRECERLQGFPDDFTRIPARQFKSKPRSKNFEKYPDYYDEHPDGTWTQHHPDGVRYKALGNSMAVPVVRWIGERIMAVEKVLEAAS